MYGSSLGEQGEVCQGGARGRWARGSCGLARRHALPYSALHYSCNTFLVCVVLPCVGPCGEGVGRRNNTIGSCSGGSLRSGNGLLSPLYTNLSPRATWPCPAPFRQVWDLAGGFCTHSFAGHGGVVLRVAFHPKSLQLFSAADDGGVRVWDLVDKSCVYSLKVGHVCVDHPGVC